MSAKNLTLATVLSMSLAPIIVYGAPFGLTMGMQLDDLNEIELSEFDNNLYISDRLPRNHVAFESYILQIHPATGLCLIRAIGKFIESSSQGTELVSTFDDLRGQLDRVYGESNLVSFLRTGSIWDEPEDYMIAIEKKERVLQAIWENEDGSVIGNEVVEAILSAKALSDSTGYVVLQYRLQNEAECAHQKFEEESGVL